MPMAPDSIEGTLLDLGVSITFLRSIHGLEIISAELVLLRHLSQLLQPFELENVGSEKLLTECRGFRDIPSTKHASQHGKDLVLCSVIILGFDAVTLLCNNSDKENSRADEEARSVERLKHRVVAALKRVCVEEKLSVLRPENFGKLEEDLCVCSHRKSFYTV